MQKTRLIVERFLLYAYYDPNLFNSLTAALGCSLLKVSEGGLPLQLENFIDFCLIIKFYSFLFIVV